MKVKVQNSIALLPKKFLFIFFLSFALVLSCIPITSYASNISEEELVFQSVQNFYESLNTQDREYT